MEILVSTKDGGPLKPDGHAIAIMPDGVCWTPEEMAAWIDEGVEPASAEGLHNASGWRSLIARTRALLSADPREAERVIVAGRGLKAAETRAALPKMRTDARQQAAVWRDEGRDSNWGPGDESMPACIIQVPDDDEVATQLRDVEHWDQDDGQGNVVSTPMRRKFRVPYEDMLSEAEIEAARTPGQRVRFARESARAESVSAKPIPMS